MERLTNYRGIEYPHKVLWAIVEDMAGLANERGDRGGWFNPTLVAMVFAFHTVEAFINFIGEELDAENWIKERKIFPSLEARLKAAFELADVPWTPDERPLSTVLDLKELRDRVAHGKPQRFVEQFIDDGLPFLPLSHLRAAVTPREALPTAIRDVEVLIERLHANVKSRIEDPFFQASALHGPAQWGEGSAGGSE